MANNRNVNSVSPLLRERFVSPICISVIGAFFVGCFAFLLAGLIVRQILESDEYTKRFSRQTQRIVLVPAPRGEILDRHGDTIVTNRARFSIVADLGMLRLDIDARYREILRKELKKRRENASDALKELNSTALLNIARVEILQEWQEKVGNAIGRKNVLDSKNVIRHFSQRRTLDFPLFENLTERERARFAENFHVNAPVKLYVDSVRFYPHGALAAHVLGYLKNSDDLDFDVVPEQFRGISISRYRGKSGATGIEMRFENALAGTPGFQVFTALPNGYLFEKIAEEKPKQGSHIYTSIDIELQKNVEKALEKIGKPGAAIVLDVNSGEILAMASALSYDPNKFSNALTKAYQDEISERDQNAFANRALQGRYPPGSTFKIITAIAAMLSEKIEPDQEFDCGSFLRVDKRNWPEHDGAAFGLCDVTRMLRVSGNVYCYNAALEIGWKPISAEAKRFGLDKKLEVELPEATGLYLVVPDPKYKRGIGAGGWVAGDTLNMSIGQGYLLTSPLHIACMTASLARNETRTRPSILFDASRQNGVPVDHGGEKIGLSERAREKILQGMREAVEFGTGRRAKVPGLEIAGKTGTAQWQNRGKNSNLAWFTGFAPIENPQIAVTVVFEAEREERIAGGATAAPVAAEIFQKWKALYFDK